MTGVGDMGGMDKLDGGTTGGAGGNGTAAAATPVFFLAGGTGISAETLGNMMLQQFPTVSFSRRKIPFITTVERAREVVGDLDATMTDAVTPLVFSTVADEAVRAELQKTRCAFIDLFGSHLDTIERVLHVNASHDVGALHGVGDLRRYEARMKAIDFAMEHDDGQSLRNLEQAELILIAPSRCGKTPTSMYLALQHGIKVANYPLVDEDFEHSELPRPVRPYAAKCVASDARGRPTPCSRSAATSCAGPRASTGPTASRRSTPRRCPWRRWPPSSCRAPASPTCSSDNVK